MSLKAIHLMFVGALTALAFGLGVWKTSEFIKDKAPGDLAFAICSFVAAGLMVWYGKKVLKKLRSISFY